MFCGDFCQISDLSTLAVHGSLHSLLLSGCLSCLLSITLAFAICSTTCKGRRCSKSHLQSQFCLRCAGECAKAGYKLKCIMLVL